MCDWHARGRINVIGALIDKCLLTVGVFKSNIDADIFFGWTIHDLLPTLPPAAVVVMDNATFHKRLDIQNAITQAGHTLEYLPAYSPDLNPIEHKWATDFTELAFQCSGNALPVGVVACGYA